MYCLFYIYQYNICQVLMSWARKNEKYINNNNRMLPYLPSELSGGFIQVQITITTCNNTGQRCFTNNAAKSFICSRQAWRWRTSSCLRKCLLIYADLFFWFKFHIEPFSLDLLDRSGNRGCCIYSTCNLLQSAFLFRARNATVHTRCFILNELSSIKLQLQHQICFFFSFFSGILEVYLNVRAHLNSALWSFMGMELLMH